MLLAFISFEHFAFKFLKVKFQVSGVVVNISRIIFPSTDSLDKRQSPH
jgi:hypothetical protein